MKIVSFTGRLGKILDALRTNFWFIPSTMTVSAIALSLIVIEADRRVGEDVISWIWTGNPEGARAVLSTIASSMITVAGVVFSITIVALTLASSQFGPRLLRSFMRDRSDQFVLGTFVSTFIYSILVLRAVHNDFVPYIAVSIGIAFSVLSVGVLIHFIHHVATSIQAENLSATVAHELVDAIEKLAEAESDPSRRDTSETEHPLPDDLADGSCHILAAQDGYIQFVDHGETFEIAKNCDLLLVLCQRPGDFVAKDSLLGYAYPKAHCSEKTAREIQRRFIIDSYRTSVQDIRYGMHQLVEIALRALSPGINDPFTAATCIDWLGVALGRLAQCDFSFRYQYDDAGKLRLVIEHDTFNDLVDTAFNQIRRAGRSHPFIALRLLQTASAIVPRIKRPADAESLRQQIEWVKHDAIEAAGNRQDRKLIREAAERTRKTVDDHEYSLRRSRA